MAERGTGSKVQMQEFISTYISRRQDAFHDDSDIIDGLLEMFSREELELYGYSDFIKDYFSEEE